MRLLFKLNKFIQPIFQNKTSKNVASINSNFDELKVKIGLEIHAKILSKTKIFSDADCFDLVNSPTNSNVSYFDVAFPGTMPTLNKKCVEASLSTCLALNCFINSVSYFERKHYFYADLPAGFQITQERRPIGVNGSFQYPIRDPKTQKIKYKSCKISRIQLEHDSARSLQLDEDFKKSKNENLPSNAMLIDLNRAGIGLMEVFLFSNIS